jgi:hypothetical protein
MAENEDDNAPAPKRPKRAIAAFTHTAAQFRRIGKKWGIYKTVGAARAAPCPHCGQPYTGKIKVFVDLLVAFGGGTGAFLVEANGAPLPTLPNDLKDFPEQTEFDEKELLPGSGD